MYDILMSLNLHLHELNYSFLGGLFSVRANKNNRVCTAFLQVVELLNTCQLLGATQNPNSRGRLNIMPQRLVWLTIKSFTLAPLPAPFSLILTERERGSVCYLIINMSP